MAIICICRGTRSGGQAMAECLAARLGYPLLGREVAEQAAARLGVPAEALQAKMGDRPSLWGRFSSERRTYIVAMQAAIAERAAEGRLIYHGLAGGLLLGDAVPGTLCLRLIAPMEDRVRAVMSTSAMDVPAAEQYIRDIDESRARWVRVMYGEDIMDPVLYDMVVNLETITIDGACAIVGRVVQLPEFELTERSRARLLDFRTACRVRLALAGDEELRALELDASAEAGEVTITGAVPLRHSGRAGTRIVELARAVDGVERVRLKVEWFDPYP